MSNFNRPPRIQPELPVGETDVPPPPPAGSLTSTQNLLTILLPGAGAVAYAFVTLMGNQNGGDPGGRLLFVVPMFIGILVSIVIGFRNYRRFQAIEAQKQAHYESTLQELRKGLNRSHDQQRLYYFHTHPNPADLASLVKQGDLRLWERRPADEDFAIVRIGKGLQPSTVTLNLSNADTAAPQYPAAMTLISDFATVKDVPVAVNLRAIHSVGMLGSNEVQVKNTVRSMLMEFCVLHAPSEARLFIVGNAETRDDWIWARWLPQANSAKAERGDGDQLRFSKGQVQRLWTELGTELDRRASRQAEKGAATMSATPEVEVSGDPFLLVIVDATRIDFASVDDANPLSAVQTEGAVSTLLRDGQRLNAAVIFITQDRRQVPADCRAIIEIETDPKGQPAFRYAEIGLNSARRDGRADQATAADADILARALAPLEMHTAYGSDLPSAFTLLQMLHDPATPGSPITDLDQIPIGKFWQASMDTPESWPKVSLGMRNSGKLLDLILNAPEAGNHGLIAGTTGSGKSELILTLIAWLALNYDPRLVNFVLVDYKGGTSLDVFRELPHTVDMVTNLNAAATARTFTALKAELRRRQTILKQNGAQDIEAYQIRQMSSRLTTGGEPMPHLFIIIDEFAEMIKDLPDSRADMVSIAALGRSLGIHLLLATQKPDGVVSEQIRANMKFRICLRVERPEDSRELLRRPDAAFLPPNIPGRAYLQIGNERVELFQVARTGGPYLPVRQSGEQEQVVFLKEQTVGVPIPQSEVAVAKKAPSDPIVFLSDAASGNGNKIPARPEAPAEPVVTAVKDATPTLSRAVAGKIAAVAREYGIPRQVKPWPDPLPARLYLSSLSQGVAAWANGGTNWPEVRWRDGSMQPIVGLLDDPARMEQPPLRLDLPRGNVVVFGASGWGKTTLLRTLILDLAATHSPSDLHIYILDFGGQGLRPFESMPHVAAIVSPADTERVTRLLRRLNRTLEERKEFLSRARADSLSAYNASQPAGSGKTLPAICVLLDNFAEFRESFADDLETLTGLAREGRAYGIHFVVTADQPAVMTTKLYGAFTERLALRLAEVSDFSTIVGRGIFDPDLLAGRGYIRVGKTPLEFHVALPVGTSDHVARAQDKNQEAILDTADDLEQGRGIEKLSNQMRDAWKDRPGKPRPITVLERNISLTTIIDVPPQPRVTAVLGVDDFDLAPVVVAPHQSGPHLQIIGPPSSGRTTALRTLLLSVAARHSAETAGFYLIDFRGRLMRYGVDTLPHVLGTAGSAPELQALTDKIRQQYQAAANEGKPLRETFVLIDDYDLIVSTDRLPALDTLAELARQYGSEGLYFIMTMTPNSVRGSDPILKNVQLSRFALTFDANSLLELGVRGVSFGNTAVPTGRGFLVRSGQAKLMQIATPQLSNADMEASIRGWVQRLKGA